MKQSSWHDRRQQDFEANGCDAGDVFKQATDLVAQVIAQIK